MELKKAIQQNQTMIKEWAEECKQDNLLAFLTLCFDENQNIKIFRSAGIDCKGLITMLRYTADNLQKNPF